MESRVVRITREVKGKKEYAQVMLREDEADRAEKSGKLKYGSGKTWNVQTTTKRDLAFEISKGLNTGN